MAALLGYDVGSSSIKATLLDADTGRVLASAISPDKELPIISARPGWAEQDPRTWWRHIQAATARIRRKSGKRLADTKAIGISYQMHGLVLVDRGLSPLRNAIIWCDSRAVEIGAKAAADIGPIRCLKSLLNLPGNFTASKLAWVRENEPEIYARIHKAMLPGDYVAMQMTGRVATTASGLSEGIMWDFTEDRICDFLLDHYHIDPVLLPQIAPTFGDQGALTSDAAGDLGLPPGIPVSYRAGDQPNNAFSLGVVDPGQAAVTAGTSGVVYGVTDQVRYDEKSRINTFIHVNHDPAKPRYGVLLCVNGAGILNSWLKHNLSDGRIDYPVINKLAGEVPVGCQELVILPYGNGAERTLENLNPGASVTGWNFNIHSASHFYRAAQEGIVFALNYGLRIMRSTGTQARIIRAGNANMFLSGLFSSAFATVTGATVELYDTDGSQGAARAAGVGAGVFGGFDQAFEGLQPVRTIEPDQSAASAYKEAYQRWTVALKRQVTSIASP